MEATRAATGSTIKLLKRKFGPFVSVLMPFGSEEVSSGNNGTDSTLRRSENVISSVKRSPIPERLKTKDNMFNTAAITVPPPVSKATEPTSVSPPVLCTVSYGNKAIAFMFLMRSYVQKIVPSPLFFTIIMTIIIVNTIIIGIQTEKELEMNYPVMFITFHYIFLAIYILEILLKWYCDFFGFWKSFGNVFDFVIIIITLFGPIFSFIPGSQYVLRLLRMILALRIIRSFTALRGLRLVVQSVIHAVTDTVSILFFLSIIMFIFAFIGITLFGNNCPTYFGTLGSAMFSLFICLTQDGWTRIRIDLQNCGYDVMGPIYLILFVIIGSFILGNLIVAVIITNFESSLQEEEGIVAMNQSKEVTSNITINVSDLMVKCQSAMATPVISPTIEKLEKLLFLVSAIEGNLTEFKKIQKDLYEILNKVKALSEIEETNTIENLSVYTPSARTTSKSRTRSFRHSLFDQRGDTISALISLSRRQVTEGSNVTTLNSLFTHLQPYPSRHEIS